MRRSVLSNLKSLYCLDQAGHSVIDLIGDPLS